MTVMSEPALLIRQVATELRGLCLLAKQHAEAITDGFVEAQLGEGPESSTLRILLDNMARTALSLSAALEQTAATAQRAIGTSATLDTKQDVGWGVQD